MENFLVQEVDIQNLKIITSVKEISWKNTHYGYAMQNAHKGQHLEQQVRRGCLGLWWEKSSDW